MTAIQEQPGTAYRDPYAATHFEPGCPECDALWVQLLAATSGPGWETKVEQVTAEIQAHARQVHDLTLGHDCRRSTAPTASEEDSDGR